MTLIAGLTCLVAFLAPPPAPASGLWRAPDAAKSAIDALPACLRWRIVGLCFWLDCGWHGCHVRVSLKTRNYAPDAFATTFTSDMALTDAAGHIEARKHEGGARDHQIFRDADLYGHPLGAAGFLGAAAKIVGIGAGLLCLPRTVPLFPYFESTLDAAAWRGIVPIESLYPASTIPGLREIGSFPANTWGNLYPRTGRVVQQEEPKAGAVLVQRAGDIATRTGQPHAYVPLSALQTSGSGMRYWNPGPLVEGNADTGTWQMFHPREDHSCYAFGTNDASGGSSWSDGRRSADGEYAFNLWRPYTCCRDRGIFLFSIDF